MSKKFYIPMVVAVLAALFAGLWLTQNAVAQEGGGDGLLDKARRARPVLGQVTEIKNNEFTIQKRDGTQQAFHVDDETRFRDRDRNELTFEDLATGRWVLVAAPDKQGEKPVARLVVLLPEDFDPDKQGGVRGLVESVDVAASAFTLKNRQGQAKTVNVNDETAFKGEAEDLASLEVEMRAGAAGETLEDGSLLATMVRSGYVPVKKAGEVVTVDEAASTFTLKARRDGEEVTFAVDENTRFRSKDNEVGGLADLEEGMIAVVVAKGQSEGGTPVAALVAVGEKRDLPKADKRLVGKVLSVDKNSFTIQGRDGQEYTIQVTGDTRFRGRGVQVDGLEDLKAGMAVLVGAKELGNGQYQAQIVIARQPQTPAE